MPDLDGLLVFSRVVSEGSFTGAGTALGLPRSTVSRRISALEEHLGVRLLHRTTRTVQVTEVGRSLYERAAPLLEALQDAEHTTRTMQDVPRGKLRITAPVNFGDSPIGPILFDFLDTYPEVELEVVLTDRYVDIVREGFDLALRAGVLADSSLFARRVAASRSALVATAGYIAEHGRPETPEELASHECITAPKDGPSVWEFRRDAEKRRVTVRGRFAVGGLALLRQAALAGRGVARLPYILVAPALESGELVELLPDWNQDTRPLSLVYASNRHLSPKVRSFIDFFAERFRLPDFAEG